LTSFEEFLKSPLFERKDVLGLVHLLRGIILDLIINNHKIKSKMTLLDDFVLYSSSVLLKLLHEMFAVKDFVDPHAWDLNEFKWD
jgi:hypothetical protein